MVVFIVCIYEVLKVKGCLKDGVVTGYMGSERKKRKPDMKVHAFTLSYWVLGQEDHEFKANLNYIAFEY